MKKLILVFIPFLLLACSSQSIEPPSDAVVAISADEIRSNAGALAGQQFVSTGQPDKEILSMAKDAGFVAVVDLRRESEERGYDEAAAVEALGMAYVSIPVAGADGTTFDNARQLDSVLDEINGPVLLHCASGNRVGALIALRASLNGASDEEALAAGKAAGLTRLEPVVTKLLEEN